jgi:3-dehydroquinate synthase
MNPVAQELMTIKSSFEDYKVVRINTLNEISGQLENDPDLFLLVDRKIEQIYGQDLLTSLNVPKFLIDATETSKQLETVERICDWLMQNGATKTSTLVAIGGGVVQDLATFVSHIYYRGIRWIYMPSTVLSMADSCVGAKCALNLSGHKNQLGVIHAPRKIVIFPGFLATLPKPEVASGLGEILKLSVTGPGQFFEEFKSQALNENKLEELIVASLLSKKIIIELDEMESDLRRILNYGHSFGHAIESLSNNEVTHGEAILFGMDLINYLGRTWGITNPDFEVVFRQAIQEIFPNVSIPKNISPGSLVNELKRDKKMSYGKMVFAVPTDVGDITLVTKELDQNLVEQVSDFIENVWQKTPN